MKKLILFFVLSFAVDGFAKLLTTEGVFVGTEEGDYCYMTFQIKGQTESFMGCDLKHLKTANSSIGKILEIKYEEKKEFIPEANQKILRKILKSVKVK